MTSILIASPFQLDTEGEIDESIVHLSDDGKILAFLEAHEPPQVIVIVATYIRTHFNCLAILSAVTELDPPPRVLLARPPDPHSLAFICDARLRFQGRLRIEVMPYSTMEDASLASIQDDKKVIRGGMRDQWGEVIHAARALITGAPPPVDTGSYDRDTLEFMEKFHGLNKLHKDALVYCADARKPPLTNAELAKGIHREYGTVKNKIGRLYDIFDVPKGLGPISLMLIVIPRQAWLCSYGDHIGLSS